MEKLSNYDPKYANVKISMVAMMEQLEALEAMANDPAKVKKWRNRVWMELQKCQVAA